MNSSRSHAVLRVSLDQDLVCEVLSSELPVEKTPLVHVLEAGRRLVFEASDGRRYEHLLGSECGWFGLSVRVHQNLICQADCIHGAEQNVSPEQFAKGQIRGIRFEPIFLPGFAGGAPDLKGRGLFARGLHYPGLVSPGNLSLSCLCDVCRRSFRLQSFHAGFSHVGCMYSESGAYTLLIPERVPGAPPAMCAPDLVALEQLESALPPAPDGSAFRYRNPLRCPHCRAPYIDFHKYPKQRDSEYYGNTYYGQEPIGYPPALAR